MAFLTIHAHCNLAMHSSSIILCWGTSIFGPKVIGHKFAPLAACKLNCYCNSVSMQFAIATYSSVLLLSEESYLPIIGYCCSSCHLDCFWSNAYHICVALRSIMNSIIQSPYLWVAMPILFCCHLTVFLHVHGIITLAAHAVASILTRQQQWVFCALTLWKYWWMQAIEMMCTCCMIVSNQAWQVFTL